jgi:hypothetical protein
MTPQKNYSKIASSLLLVFILFGISLASATTENGYNNDNNLLTTNTETTLTENGYKTNIIINPRTTGTYATENGYKLDLTINPNGIGGGYSENGYKLSLIPEKTFPDIPDIAIMTLTTSGTHVTEGYSTSISVTITNKGYIAETFQVSIYAKNKIVQTFSYVTLPSKNSTTLTFEWYFPRGFYTLSAYASPIPYEVNTADNTHTNGIIKAAPIALTRNGDGRKVAL